MRQVAKRVFIEHKPVVFAHGSRVEARGFAETKKVPGDLALNDAGNVA
jgi:hypothetical protein